MDINTRSTGDTGIRLLKPQEVADILGVPVATLYGWRYRRIGPNGLKVGRHLRYRAEDVERFISNSADRQS
jgi:predicted DNA-binding transcriptional regulator AlpA